jgi:glycosyltransferase involved in cell wall biosynthesis
VVGPDLTSFATTKPKFGYEVTILIPIFNKAHYLSLSLPSIFNLPIRPYRVCVLCYDDGSSDNTVASIREYQRDHPRLFLIEGKVHKGTLWARIQLIEATKTPWLVFLDPDDELVGSGLERALDLIQKTGADIVQFGCRQVVRRRKRTSGCWREPRIGTTADVKDLTRLWVRGRVDVHVHRKVWSTELFQRAVRFMDPKLRHMLILRAQDTLLYGHVLLVMKGFYRYIPVVGEIRHCGWPDNSKSTVLQSKAEKGKQVHFVANWTARYFGRAIFT